MVIVLRQVRGGNPEPPPFYSTPPLFGDASGNSVAIGVVVLPLVAADMLKATTALRFIAPVLPLLPLACILIALFLCPGVSDGSGSPHALPYLPAATMMMVVVLLTIVVTVARSLRPSLFLAL